MGSHWAILQQEEAQKPYFKALMEFLAAERKEFEVYPPSNLVFAALDKTPLENTRVVILGQDPYHSSGQAHGLSFSVQHGVAVPPSLRNIFKELHDDVGIHIPTHGNLSSWASQGVLLLNTSLTVRTSEAASHAGRGWEIFTDEVISQVNAKQERVVFILWGAHARKKKALITNPLHQVVESAHPSPLSARHGFFGSKPFSQANLALKEVGLAEIDWSLPEI